MSNSEENNQIPKNYRLGIIAFLGVMLVFAGVVWIPYFSTRPGPADEEIVAARKTTLSEVNAKQQDLINSYAWIDKEAKIVRIPVDRAMQLSIKSLNEKKPLVSNKAAEEPKPTEEG